MSRRAVEESSLGKGSRAGVGVGVGALVGTGDATVAEGGKGGVMAVVGGGVGSGVSGLSRAPIPWQEVSVTIKTADKSASRAACPFFTEYAPPDLFIYKQNAASCAKDS